jgi:hypothetical protein
MIRVRIEILSTGRVFFEDVESEEAALNLASSVEEHHPGDCVVTGQGPP